jgi:hypothetical protein
MEIGLPGGVELAALAEGTSTKTFLPKGSIDRARLGWRSGAAVELRWDAGLTPYVGVWVCNGDLGGYRQIAIEPSTGGMIGRILRRRRRCSRQAKRSNGGLKSAT